MILKFPFIPLCKGDWEYGLDMEKMKVLSMCSFFATSPFGKGGLRGILDFQIKSLPASLFKREETMNRFIRAFIPLC